MKTIMAVIMLGIVGLVKGDNAWDNYYNNNGEYFDKFFPQYRVMFYAQDRIAHEATLRQMARYGIKYQNQYTGRWNYIK